MIFSVVVPTHNRLEKLKRALLSLKNQEFFSQEYEVLVIDDGSTDGTFEFLKSQVQSPSKIRVFFQSRQGPAAARNMGIRESRAEIIAFTDDDCEVPSSWLKGLYQGYLDHPQCGGVGGFLEAPVEILKNNPLARLEFYETHFIYGASADSYIGGFETPSGGTNNMSYPKRVLEEVGMFDESFPVPAGEDADLKLRVIQKGYSLVFVPLPVTHLDAYSLKSFWHRSVVRGIGSAFFETKHNRVPSLTDLFLSVATLPKIFLGTIFKSKDLTLSLLFCLKVFLMTYGKVIYLLRLRKKL